MALSCVRARGVSARSPATDERSNRLLSPVASALGDPAAEPADVLGGQGELPYEDGRTVSTTTSVVPGPRSQRLRVTGGSARDVPFRGCIWGGER